MSAARAPKGNPGTPRGPYRKTAAKQASGAERRVSKGSPRLGLPVEHPVSVKETTLSARNRKFAAAIAGAMPVADAAKSIGLTAPSGYRLLRDPVIAAEITRIQDEAANAVMIGLRAKVDVAVTTLIEVMAGGKDGHKDMPRLKAAEFALALIGITPESMTRQPADPVFGLSDAELEEDVLAFADQVRGARK